MHVDRSHTKQAQAGGGVAVVDRAAVAGPTFSRLAVRPFQTRERLPVALLRNRYRPPSLVQEVFCEAFEAADDRVTSGRMVQGELLRIQQLVLAAARKCASCCGPGEAPLPLTTGVN